jgi:hypothetical protein
MAESDAPLSIIIESDTTPCHFVSTSYTDNFLEYSVIKIMYTNNSALTNKTYSGKKPLTVTSTYSSKKLFIVTQGGSWVVT